MTDLKSRSIDIIISNQHPTGAYIASPNFDTYKYCWLRDGSFIAYSMDISGQTDSAARFFDWVNQVISRQSQKVEDITKKYSGNQALESKDFLPTRYTLEGEETGDEWPNFQLDGYGTWLWALHEHIHITGDKHLIEEYKTSVRTTIDYLVHCWNIPNFDCWEENGDKIHPSTLACIYGGLKAISAYIEDDRLVHTTHKIKEYILQNCMVDGRLAKYEGSDSVDGSLLWVSVPFGVLEMEDERMVKTVEEIEKRLLYGGGVHRYPEDTYYGGGQWLLLSCWLGWYYAKSGRSEKLGEILEWVEKTVNEKGEMPEQTLEHVNNPEYIEKWKNQWGEVANPLLWSHAMYLVACNRR